MALQRPHDTGQSLVRAGFRVGDQKDLVIGGQVVEDDSEYGLFVKTVDGYTADDAKQEWWCFTQDGGQVNTGVDTTPVADGDHFEITLTAGY